MKKMKTIWKVLLIIALVLALLVAGFFIALNWGMHKTKTAAVHSIDPSALADGTYTGTYTAGRWTNEVAVTIQDHRIVDIEVVKDILFITPEFTDGLINEVIEKQDCKVDIVSGGTVSSKAYMLSIEDALTEK
jgi:uncharacterized protein with FMN-binding domain